MRYHFYTNRQKGFTLVELLVAMGIFVVVITASTTLFLKSLKAQRAIVAFAAVNDNLALSVEQMAREIRTGKEFKNEGDDLIFDAEKLHFLSAQEGTYQNKGQLYINVFYGLKDGQILRHAEGGPPVPITSDEVNISSVKFIISPNKPSLVTMIIFAKPKDAILQGDYEVKLQTTVSPRIF